MEKIAISRIIFASLYQVYISGRKRWQTCLLSRTVLTFHPSWVTLVQTFAQLFMYFLPARLISSYILDNRDDTALYVLCICFSEELILSTYNICRYLPSCLTLCLNLVHKLNKITTTFNQIIESLSNVHFFICCLILLDPYAITRHETARYNTSFLTAPRVRLICSIHKRLIVLEF